MKEVSYFPGCSLHGTAREYGESIDAVFKKLGVRLRELDDWNCCGSSSAHVTDQDLASGLAARNLVLADKDGLDLMVPCASCYQRLKYAERDLRAGKDIAGVPGGFQGDFAVKHLIDFIWEDIGEPVLRRHVSRQLHSLNVVCYYGCLTVRPPAVTGSRSPENPRNMDRIMESFGAEVTDWSYKTDCCGGNLTLTRPDIAHTLIQKLLLKANEAGAEAVVTGCPMCFSNLDSYQNDVCRNQDVSCRIPIFYISELMGIAFGLAGYKKWLGRHMVDPVPLLKKKGLLY